MHELGHFLVAKACGVKVLRFSIGFGRSLLTWHDKLGTEYVLAWLPLGGYVKMLDESEGLVAQTEKRMAYNRQPIIKRVAIIIAGPFFNLAFAWVAYWLAFVIGITALAPILGTVPKGSIVELAGLQKGDEIISVEGRPTDTWEDVSIAMMSQLGNQATDIQVREEQTRQIRDFKADLSNWSIDNQEGNILKSLGLEPFDPYPPVIGRVAQGMPAAKAGLQTGDKVLKVDEIEIGHITQFIAYVRENANKLVHIEIERDGEIFLINVLPSKKLIEGGEEVGFIGVEFQVADIPAHMIRKQQYGVLKAANMALERTVNYSILTIKFLGQLLSGQVSTKHIAGPISIAKYAGQTAKIGVEYFCSFLALVSISLGILNLLPIPVLDGGHLLFCLYEVIVGRMPSEKILQMARFTGVIILSGIMLLALFNDIVRLNF